MGDPKRVRKNYANPRMQWNEATLSHDKEIKKDYRPKNKREIWKMTAFLQNIKDQAKSINSMLGTARREQAILEQEQLVNKVKRYGLIKKDEITLSDLLSIELRDVMERRLQTLVMRKNLARSMKQSRQFVTHGHVMVGGKKVTSPSYVVPLKDEDTIDFVERSPMKATDHPERGDVDPQIVLKDSRTGGSKEGSPVEDKDTKSENKIAGEADAESDAENSDDSAEKTETKEDSNAQPAKSQGTQEKDAGADKPKE
ncbi:MAG: 30S ribosomal protein S4 [Candidatus Woesearchaeota archaeon]